MGGGTITIGLFNWRLEVAGLLAVTVGEMLASTHRMTVMAIIKASAATRAAFAGRPSVIAFIIIHLATLPRRSLQVGEDKRSVGRDQR